VKGNAKRFPSSNRIVVAIPVASDESRDKLDPTRVQARRKAMWQLALEFLLFWLLGRKSDNPGQ
jgi:hypothetical protein